LKKILAGLIVLLWTASGSGQQAEHIRAALDDVIVSEDAFQSLKNKMFGPG
jgi:hypothetical protein